MRRHRSIFIVVSGLLAVAGAASLGRWDMSHEVDGAPEAFIPDDLLKAGAVIARSPAEAQSAILADGVITLEEMNGAQERVARCIEARGLTVHRLLGQGVGGALQLEVEGDLRTTSDAGATAIHMGCYDEHAGQLNLPWAEQNRPSAAQQSASAAAFDTCVAANGEPQLATKDGEWVSSVTLTAGSRAYWVYSGCRQNGAEWRLP